MEHWVSRKGKGKKEGSRVSATADGGKQLELSDPRSSENTDKNPKVHLSDEDSERQLVSAQPREPGNLGAVFPARKGMKEVQANGTDDGEAQIVLEAMASSVS